LLALLRPPNDHDPKSRHLAATEAGYRLALVGLS